MTTLQSTVSQLFGWKYTFNSATSGDPGTGKFWFDNATIASATSFRIYKTDADGNDLSNWTDVWDDGSGSPRAYVTIRSVTDETAFVVFGITSDDAGGLVNYRTYSILIAESGGTFSNDDECTVTWTASGKTVPLTVYDQTISAAASNVDIGTATVARITPSGATRAITGIVAKADGTVIRIVNPSTSGQTLNVSHNTTSTAANQFLLRGGATLGLTPGQAITFVYCTTSQRWVEC